MKNRQALFSIFIPTLEGGGAEKVMLNLVKGFIKKGFAVHLLLVNKKGSYLNELPKECRIIDFKSKKTIFAIFKLFRYLKKEKPYVLISNLTHANIVSSLAIILSNKDTKLILIEHSTLKKVLENNTNILGRLFFKSLIFFLFPRADAIIVVSEGAAKDFSSSFPKLKEKIKVIYNPLDLDDIAMKGMEEVVFPWEDSSKKPIILSVGRLTKQKDFKTLILAFIKVRMSLDSYLVILGEGEERKKLEQMIKDLGIVDSVYMPGFVHNPYKYMKKASVFVLSSIYEGFAIVIAEALACGTPVVSTNCESGPSEILDGGKYGFLVSVNDHNALAEAILSTIKNPPDKETLIERAKVFSLEIAISKYISEIGLSKIDSQH